MIIYQNQPPQQKKIIQKQIQKYKLYETKKTLDCLISIQLGTTCSELEQSLIQNRSII